MPPRNLNLGVIFVGQVHPSVRQAITQVTQAINQATAGTRNMTVSFQQQNAVLTTSSQKLKDYADKVKFFFSTQAAWYGAKALLFAAVDIPKQIAKMGYDFSIQLDSARAKLDRYDSMLGQTTEKTKAATASLVEMMRVLNLKYPGTPFDDIVKSADRLRAAGADMADIRRSLESFVQFQTAWPEVEMDKFTKAVVGFVNTYRKTPAFAIMADDAERYKAVLDKLTVAAGIGVIEPKDMNLVIQHLGQMAQVAGLSVDQMLALSVEMTNLGAKSGPAARALRGMLQTLQRKDALELFEQLNIRIDKTIPLGGQLVSIFNQLRELTGKGEKGMSVQAASVLNKIFSTERVGAAIALIREMDKYEELVRAIEDSEMANARAAQDMNNQLKNKWELVKKVAAEVGTLLIQSDLMTATLKILGIAFWGLGTSINGVITLLRYSVSLITGFVTGMIALTAAANGDKTALTNWWSATKSIWGDIGETVTKNQAILDKIVKGPANLIEEAEVAKMKKQPFAKQKIRLVGGEYEFAGATFKTLEEAKQHQAELIHYQFYRRKPEVKSEGFPVPKVPGKYRSQAGYEMSEMRSKLAIQRSMDAMEMAELRVKHNLYKISDKDYYEAKEALRKKDFDSEIKYIEETRKEVEKDLNNKKVTKQQAAAVMARLEKEEANVRSKNRQEELSNYEEYQRSILQAATNTSKHITAMEKASIDFISSYRMSKMQEDIKHTEFLYERGEISFAELIRRRRDVETAQYRLSAETAKKEFINKMRESAEELGRVGMKSEPGKKLLQERELYIKEYHNRAELLQQEHVNRMKEIDRDWIEEIDVGFGSAINKLRKRYENVGKYFEDITIEFSDRMSQAFTDGFVAFFTGQTDDIREVFKRLFEDILRMMIEVIAKMTMFTILNRGAAPGLPIGWNTGNTAAASTMLYQSPLRSVPVTPGLAHGGGTVGSLATRMLSGAIARIAHSGLNDEEYLTVLRRGETVYPAGKRPSSGANIDVLVNVENKTGFPVQSKGTEMRFDGKKWVKSIILELSQTDPQFRSFVGRTA
mgnify:CR=1 FL=1